MDNLFRYAQCVMLYCYMYMLLLIFCRGNPYTFQVGSPNVMRAFNFGVKGMCIGERRRFFMPPEFVTAQFHTGEWCMLQLV